MRRSVLSIALMSFAMVGCSSPSDTTQVAGTNDPLVSPSGLGSGMIWTGHLVSPTLLGAWQSEDKRVGALVFEPDGTYRIVANHHELEHGRWTLSGTRIALKSGHSGDVRTYTFTNPKNQEVRMVPDASSDGRGATVFHRTVPAPPAVPVDWSKFSGC